MTLMYQEYFEVEIFMEQVIFLVIAQKKKTTMLTIYPDFNIML